MALFFYLVKTVFFSPEVTHMISVLFSFCCSSIFENPIFIRIYKTNKYLTSFEF